MDFGEDGEYDFIYYFYGVGCLMCCKVCFCEVYWVVNWENVYCGGYIDCCFFVYGWYDDFG